MTDTAAFTSFAPGFEFLQGLVKNAGAALPGMGQWVAPTLNPEELDKRIQELKTVQFWLEQNARMLGATIQALEVQKMTLTTLQTMNVQMGDLRDALTIRMPGMPAMAAVHSAALSAVPPTEDDEPDTADARNDAPASTASAPGPAAAPSSELPAATGADAVAGARAPALAPSPVDPMQWWGALTQQFSELASSALKDVASATPPPAPTAKAARATSATAARAPRAAVPKGMPKKAVSRSAKAPARKPGTRASR